MRGRRRVGVAVGVIGLALVVLACDPVTIDQRALYTTLTSVTITGSVEPRSGDVLTSVSVNGVTATLTDDKYSAVVPVNGGPTFVPVVATAHFQSGFTGIQRSTVAWANGSTVTLVAKGSALANAVVTRLTPTALTKLGPGSAASVAFPTSTFAVPATDLGGDIFDVQILAGGSTTLSAPTLALDVSTGNLRAVQTYATVHQIVPVQVQGFTGPQNCTLDITFAPLTGTSTYTVAPDATADFKVSPAAAPTAASTVMGTSGCAGTTTQANAIPQVVDFVQPATQNALVVALADPDGAGSATAPLAAGLQTRLATLNVSGTIGGSTAGVALAAPMASVGFSTAGLGAADNPTYTSSSVAAGAQAQSASLAFGSSSATLPGVGAFDWATGLSAATVNQLLAVDTERGRLNRTVTTIGGLPLTYNKLDSVVGLGGPISPDRPVTALLAPELSPAVTDAAPTGSNVGVLHLAGMRVTVTFGDSSGGTILDSVFDADGAATFGVTAGAVTLKGTGFTASRRDVLANPRGLTVVQSNGVVSALMADLTAPLVSGLPVVGAPVVPGLTLAVTSTSRVGSNLYVFGSYS